MKSVTEQLATYKSVHLNKNNIKTHFVGIPLIIWSVALLIADVRFNFTLFGDDVSLSLTVCLSGAAFLYYCVLSIPLAILSLPLFGGLIYSAMLFSPHPYSWHIAIAALTIGWIFQFIGHAYEKAKPAFVDDLLQLAIGPLFLLAEIYFSLGFDKSLAKAIEEMALEKRRQFEQLKTS